MPIIENDNTEEIVKDWDHPIQPHETDNLYKLLEVISSENDRLDLELNELYENRFLDTATGLELEKVGDLVGVNRKTGESDGKLRKRIRGAFAAQASDTTYESFANTAISILEADLSEIEFVTPPDTPPKVVEIQLDGSVFNGIPLTKNELVILLNGAVSIDARVRIKETGTFAFDGNDSSLKGFNEGTWSVGVSN